MSRPCLYALRRPPGHDTVIHFPQETHSCA
jgi:hypothetical protein